MQDGGFFYSESAQARGHLGGGCPTVLEVMVVFADPVGCGDAVEPRLVNNMGAVSPERCRNGWAGFVEIDGPPAAIEEHARVGVGAQHGVFCCGDRSTAASVVPRIPESGKHLEGFTNTDWGLAGWCCEGAGTMWGSDDEEPLSTLRHPMVRGIE